MTRIIVYKDSRGEYKKLRSIGHADSGEYGQDIVCASISVLLINTINSLEKFTTDDIVVNQDEQQGLIEIIFKQKISKEGGLLIDSLVLGLLGIQEAYGSRYIKVFFKEV